MAITADMDRPMDGDVPQDRQGFGWGIAISLVLHALAALMLTGVISGYVSQPIEDTVEVELVPPPEETAPPAVPEEPKPEEPEIPEPEQAEPAVAPPPPPPPPPAPQLQDQAVTPPADVPVLQPVEEFGEEDTGPVGEETPPEEPAEAEAPEEPVETEQPAETEPARQTDAEAEEPEETAAGEDDPADAAETDTVEAGDDAEAEPDPVPVPEDAPQESDTADTQEAEPVEEAEAASGTEADADIGIAEIAAPEDFGVVGPIVTEATPAPKPARAVRPETSSAPAARRDTARTGASGPPAGMLAARQLYSRDILDAPQARTAMRGMSEGQRLNLLCMTELRAQISSVSALPPELLPRFRPPPGNVLQPKTAAFRSLGRWFDVSFRCETDGGVTRVENFAFKIGNEIPQSQWLERGLTGF